jgi:2-iminobutanoate/2-iminopropanoate deaminase
MDHLTQVPSRLPMSFSDALRIADGGGSWYFISGQFGIALGNEQPPASFEEEVRRCFDRVGAALGKLGVTFAHVVKIQAFLTDLSLYEEYSRVRSELFSPLPPASTAVQVAGLLLNARIEVDAVAFAPAVS